MTDLQAQISANLGDTIMQMQRVENSLDRLDDKAKKATRSARDLQKELGKPFNKQVAEGGQRIASASGPMGSVLGRVMGGFGIDGTLGRVAVGFGLLGVAVGAAARVAEVAADRTQKLIDAEDSLAEARKKGEGVLRSQAKEGMNQRAAISLLHTFGGNDAVHRADMFAQDAGTNAADTQAAFGLALRHLDPNKHSANNALHLALKAYRGGLVGSLQEGMQALINDPHAKNLLSMPDFDKTGNSHDESKINEALAWTFRIPGRPIDKGLGERIDRTRAIDDSATRFLNATDTATGISAHLAPILRQRTTDLAEQTAREDYAAALKPVEAAILEWSKKMDKAIANMERLAESENVIAKILLDFRSAQGSATTQAIRMTNAKAGALSSPNAGD